MAWQLAMIADVPRHVSLRRLPGSNMLSYQARVQGGGPNGPGPPLEIKKQKKRASEQILSYFTYILLLFSSKISFSHLFSELGPPEKLKLKSKKKKKKAFQILGPPPPPLTNSWTRACILCYYHLLCVCILYMYIQWLIQGAGAWASPPRNA